jgi:hypothetical protein
MIHSRLWHSWLCRATRGTLESDEIGVVEADVDELPLELVQPFRRAREVQGAIEVSRQAVPPAQQHSPVRAS